MSQFSILLSKHIKNKSIRTYSLAQYCDMDRSNMYKMLNGKRNPSSEHMVNKIADYMRLTPIERKELLEAYKITLIGYETYYRRKNVQQFISNFSVHERPQLHTSFFSPDFNHLSEQEPVFITDKKELDQTIQGILTLESNENGHIKLLLQPSCNDIMEFLFYIGNHKKNLTIEHIFCLNNTENISSDKKDYNLFNLQNILPLYYFGYCQYTPLYYYDNILSHDNMFNLFQSMVLTSRYVLVFSEELQKGILFTQKEVIENFHKIFHLLRNETTPVVNRMNSIYEQFQYFEKLEPGQMKGYSFQYQPCFMPLIPLSFPEKYLKKELSNRSAFIDAVRTYIKKEQEYYKSGTTEFVFTEEGVREFLKTGRIFELQEDVYSPLDYNDRILLIRNLIVACKNQNYRMIRKDIPISSSHLCIYATAQTGYMLFKTVQQQLVCLTLEEPSILYAFYDYLSSLEEDLFHTTEETIQILKKLI